MIRHHPIIPDWLTIDQVGDILVCCVQHEYLAEEYDMPSFHSMQSVLVVADVFKARLVKQFKVTQAVTAKLEEDLDDFPF